jgi:hypothetical protein
MKVLEKTVSVCVCVCTESETQNVKSGEATGPGKGDCYLYSHLTLVVATCPVLAPFHPSPSGRSHPGPKQPGAAEWLPHSSAAAATSCFLALLEKVGPCLLGIFQNEALEKEEVR